MKINQVLVFAIIAVVVVIFFFIKPSVNNQSVLPPVVVSPTAPPIIVVAASTDTPTKFSAELKAKIRNEFIDNCHTKSKYSLAVCTCGADYLSANYSESDLAEMYRQYHSTNVVPHALEIAAEKCTK